MWRMLPDQKKDRKHVKGICYSNRGQEEQGQGQEKQQCTFISIVCLDSMTLSFGLEKTFVDNISFGMTICFDCMNKSNLHSSN